MYLNFKHTRNNGDATSNYNVEFESGLTIRKLVDIVLRHSPNEWGCITLTAEGCDRTDIIEYRNGQIVKQNPLFDKVADAEIGELKAQGGYSLMNYHAILTANKTEQRQPLRVCKCKSCGADIVWIKTTNGKSMPCDATAVAAYKLQRDFIGFEIDDDYYAAGSQWLDTTMSQVSIFDLLQQN